MCSNCTKCTESVFWRCSIQSDCVSCQYYRPAVLNVIEFFSVIYQVKPNYSRSNQFNFIELQIKPIYTFQIWRLWLQHMYRYWSDPYDYNSLAQVHSCWDGMVINLMEYWGKMRPSFPPTQLKIWEITTSQPSVVHSITHQSQRVSLPYLYLRVLSLVPAACWGRIYAYWYVCTYKTNWQDQMCLSQMFISLFWFNKEMSTIKNPWISY